ncbi:MAG: methyltransferase domain-containing protein [Ruminococcus sp.]|nr:methyltransferase domain-containing protein [Ruminococcus sp.]
MESYVDFARFYDSLMEDARYPERAAYLLSLCARFDHPVGVCLDLACGTGALTRELKQRGVDVFGVDGSAEMLTAAASASPDILYICQDMRELTLAKPVDTCFCTLDSLNHLTELADVEKTLSRVGSYMNAGGLLIFDVNTPYKHREVLANNAFTIENDTVFCAWQNVTEDGLLTEILLDFFEEQPDGSYQRCSECFFERAYTREELRNALRQADFELLAVYGDLTTLPPARDEQRAVYVAKKKG